MELKMNSKQLLTTTQEKIMYVWGVVVNYYNFLVYVFSRRKALYKELYEDFEKCEKQKYTIQETENFITMTDNWLRLHENKTLKEYDESCFHIGDLLVPQKLMDEVISKKGDVHQP